MITKLITKFFLKAKQAIALTVLSFTLCACALQAHEKSSALLPKNSTQARAEIIDIISQSLGGKKVPIATDVFQHSSRLLLGKAAVTSPQGIKVLRTDKKAALVFELIKQGDHCLLRRMNNAQEWQLKTKRCYVNQPNN